MEITLDDTDPRIQYSSGWQSVQGSPSQYQGNSHDSKVNGATATIRWWGTAAKIYGTMPIGSGTVRWEYSIDGGPAQAMERHTHSDEYYGDVMAETGNLNNGDHTFVIRNVGTDYDLRLDRWVLEISGMQPPFPIDALPTPSQIPPPATTRDVVITTTRTELVTQSQTPAQLYGGTANRTRTSTRSVTSSTTNGTSTVSTQSGTTPSSSPATITDTIGGPTATPTESLDPTSASGSGGLNINVMIGIGVAGAMILFLLTIIAVLLHRRRSNLRPTSKADLEASGMAPSWFQKLTRNRAATLTPFEVTDGTSRHTSTTFPILPSPTKGQRERPFIRIPDFEDGNAGSSAVAICNFSPDDSTRDLKSSVPSPRDLKPGKYRSIFDGLLVDGLLGGVPISDTLDASHDSSSEWGSRTISPMAPFTSDSPPLSRALGSDIERTSSHGEDAPPAYPGLRQSRITPLRSQPPTSPH